MFEKTLDIFEQMPFCPDEVVLIILFKTCAQLADERALKIKKKFLDQMPKLLTNKTGAVNSFLHMLMTFGDISNAENIFIQMKTKDITTYGVMMRGNLF